jgi:hypothetical protein
MRRRMQSHRFLDMHRSFGLTAPINAAIDTAGARARLPVVGIGPRQPAAYATELGRFRCSLEETLRALIKTPEKRQLLTPNEPIPAGIANGRCGA